MITLDDENKVDEAENPVLTQRSNLLMCSFSVQNGILSEAEGSKI